MSDVKLRRLDEYRWEVPKEGAMRVPGIIYASEKLMRAMGQDESPRQVANVAQLPGIVKRSLAMPDMHWGTLTYASASLPGELWLDFHLPGVLAGCALLGVVMRAGYALAGRGPGALLLYGYAFMTGVHLVEGCIASQLETFPTNLLPGLFAAWLLTRARARGPAERTP